MINFRLQNREDIPLRVDWLNNKSAVLHAIDNSDHIITSEEQNKWFDEYEDKLEKGEKIFFTILDDNKPIGFMGLSNINQSSKSATVFILIGEDEYRGRGFGKGAMKYLIDYAFDKLNLKSLKLEVDKINLPAINLYFGLGFKKVGENCSGVEILQSRDIVRPDGRGCSGAGGASVR